MAQWRGDEVQRERVNKGRRGLPGAKLPFCNAALRRRVLKGAVRAEHLRSPDPMDAPM